MIVRFLETYTLCNKEMYSNKLQIYEVINAFLNNERVKLGNLKDSVLCNKLHLYRKTFQNLNSISRYPDVSHIPEK